MSNTFKGDRVLWVVFAVLLCVSALEMYSASSSLAYKQASYIMPVWDHIKFLCVGFSVAFIVHLLPHKPWVLYSFIALYILAVVLLLWTLASGASVNAAARWVNLFGVRFQPSELGKLALVLNLSLVLRGYNQGSFFSNKAYFWICLSVAGLIAILIFPENFSTAFLCGCTTLSMMFYGRMPIKWLSMLIGTLMGILVVFYFVSPLLPKDGFLHRATVWVHRVDDFFVDKNDEDKFKIDDKNYQESHAKIAISNSNYVGRGVGNSIERDFLPQAYSDFIFAIIIEETGLLGAFVVILLYLIMLFRAAMIARATDSFYEAVMVIGLATMIFFQAFINMAVAVGLFPVTGQPLPLISRGGTSIVITSAYFGLMLWVSRHSTPESVKVKKEKKIRNNG